MGSTIDDVGLQLEMIFADWSSLTGENSYSLTNNVRGLMLRTLLLSFESRADSLNLLLKDGAKCASCTLISYFRTAGRGRILAKKTVCYGNVFCKFVPAASSTG